MPIVLGSKQPEEDRQADRPASQALKVHDEHNDNPTIPPARPMSRTLRLSTVVQIVRAPHPPPGAPEQRVIDSQADRRLGLHEHRHQEVQQQESQLVGIPAPIGEEVVRTAVMPLAGQPGGLQHPRHRAIPNTPDEPDHQHAERLKRRLRKARSQQGQQTCQRTGNLNHGGDLPVGGPRERSQRPAADGFTPTGFGVAANPPCRPLKCPADARQHHARQRSQPHPQPRKPRNSRSKSTSPSMKRKAKNRLAA